ALEQRLATGKSGPQSAPNRLATLKKDLTALKAKLPCRFMLLGRVVRRHGRAVQVFGRSVPQCSRMLARGAVLQNGNLLLLDPTRDDFVTPSQILVQKAFVYFVRQGSGANAFGQRVPLF